MSDLNIDAQYGAMMRGKRSRTWLIRGLLALFLGVLVAGIAIWDWNLYQYGAEWYSTEAQIQQLDVNEVVSSAQDAGYEREYVLTVNYGYSAEAQTYLGKHEIRTRDESNYADLLNAYAEGMTFPVWYHAGMPNQVSTFRVSNGGNIAMLVLGIVLACAGIGMIVYGRSSS